MKIKRGRPKKDNVDKALPKAPQPGSLGVNRLYKFKSGPDCLVTYGTRKKPEVVNL